MRSIALWTCILAVGLWAQAARADIYTWVDARGVRHISNHNPPPHAEVFVHTPEERPRDDAHASGAAAERQREERRATMEIREQEERLARREAQLERRIQESERKSLAALERAEDRLRAAAVRERDPRHAVSFMNVTGPFSSRSHRHRGLTRDRSDRGFARPSFEGRPFYLEAIRIPLSGVADPFRRQPADGTAFSRPPHDRDKPRLRDHRRGDDRRGRQGPRP